MGQGGFGGQLLGKTRGRSGARLNPGIDVVGYPDLPSQVLLQLLGAGGFSMLRVWLGAWKGRSAPPLGVWVG